MSDFVINKSGELVEYTGTNKDVVIPEYVTSIRPIVFLGKELNSISVPDNIEFEPMDIDTNRFIVGENNKFYSVVDGVLFDKKKEILVRMPAGKTGEYVIPYGVKQIRICAFEHTSLSKIVFPDTITAIHRLSFDPMKKLESVVLPESLSEIDFFGINAPLVSGIVLPRNIKTFSSLVDIRNMRWIEIKNPDFTFNKKSFHYYNVGRFGELTHIIHHANLPLSYYPMFRKEISIGTIVKRFQGIDVTEECWNEAVSYIRRNSRFFRWDKILSCNPMLVDFVVEQKILREEQFDSLIHAFTEEKNVELATKLIDAKEKVFPSSEQFNRILQKAENELKKAEKEIIYQQRVKDTSTVEYAKTIWDFDSCGEGCIKIKKYLGNDENVIVPDYICGKKVVEICNFAFSKNFKAADRKPFFSSILKSVYIPDTVTKMGVGVFKYCSSLSDVKLPSNLAVISDDMFSYCTSLSYIHIPESVFEIGSYAFCGCHSIKDLVFPPNLEIIKRQAFFDCKWMDSIILPDSVTVIENGAFCGCYNVVLLRLSKNITRLTPYVFANCARLKKIEIPDKIDFISKRAFNLCTNINTVIVPQKLSSNLAKCDSLNNCRVNIIVK